MTDEIAIYLAWGGLIALILASAFFECREPCCRKEPTVCPTVTTSSATYHCVQVDCNGTEHYYRRDPDA